MRINMSKIDELQDKLLNIETQINSLINEKSSVTAELESLKHQQAKEALDKVVGELKALNLDPLEIAKALGVPVAQPTQKKARAARGSAPAKVRGVPKYRSSVDPTLTWSGKGRKPGWIQTFQDNGGNLDDWLIKE